MFRALWIATVISNIGTWMNDVGSAWLMTSLSNDPLMIAMVQAATTLPMFLFALPGGVLAELVDRRRLLLGAQVTAVIAAAVLAVLTSRGMTTPWSLLGLTAAMAMAAAFSAPAFQAIVPELVDRRVLADAVSLNSLGINISRAVGPALGGVIVTMSGPAAVYALNAASTIVVIVVLARWKREPSATPLPPERFFGAVLATARYVRGAPALRLVLWRAVGFFVFASALWALLPIVGRRGLGLDAAGYGALLGCMGAGAVVGAVGLGRIRRHVSENRLSIAGSVLFALATLGLATAKTAWIAGLVMTVAGMAWITLLSAINVAAQMAAPAWIKARALAVYLLAFQGSMTAGSLIWGVAASHTSTPLTLMASAVGLLISLAVTARLRLPQPRSLDLAPSHHWAAPVGESGVDGDRGPVLVVVEYQIAPDRVAAFQAALRKFRAARRRDGARSWNLWDDLARPGLVVETFVVDSWLEHLRQHERATRDDQADQSILNGYHEGPEPPVVRHLLGSRRSS